MRLLKLFQRRLYGQLLRYIASFHKSPFLDKVTTPSLDIRTVYVVHACAYHILVSHCTARGQHRIRLPVVTIVISLSLYLYLSLPISLYPPL